MALRPSPYSSDDDLRETPPLTPEEQAAVTRAKADVAAGRLHDHAEVARWLRQRAKEIGSSAADRGSEDICFTPLP
jgi:predicted transcriptional regulator